ncbi:MAG: helix-turn-helix transcriptional regulator [Betaproteobacteria bacterium]|nr:helix-turn-helix transcriptional regulator [Betaproteobacteria bacterium]
MLQSPDDPICSLCDSLADYGANDTHSALMHAMRTISGWIYADNALWLGLVHVLSHRSQTPDLLYGWRIGALEVLHPELVPPAHLREGLKLMQTPDPGDTSVVIASTMGRFRAYSLQTGIVDLAALEKTEHYDYFYRRLGIKDRIWISAPVNADTESLFLFDSCTPDRHFSQDDIALASKALRCMKWFHRQLLCARGLGLCEEPLTPAERRLIPELLNGDAEKVIAARLGLTPATVHQYAVSIYRKFGVHGHTEFMSIWLRGRM